MSAPLYNRLANALPMASSLADRVRVVEAAQGADSFDDLPVGVRAMVAAWEAALNANAGTHRSV